MGYAGIPAAALFRVYAARWISLQDCDAQPWGVAAQGRGVTDRGRRRRGVLLHRRSLEDRGVRCGAPRDPDAFSRQEGSPPGLHAGAPERRAVPHARDARRPWVNDHRGNGRGDPRSGVGAHRRGGFRPRARPRAMVGRLIRNTREHDRVVVGIDEVSTAQAVDLSSPVHPDDCRLR